MADAAKGTIIIKKKKGGGGHAPHGGAWKVAYADFVTAMMCFFLVMWLMGADEVTLQKIERYFTQSPWDSGRDPASEMSHPAAAMQGAGDSLLKSLDGKHPDALVPHPVPPIRNLRMNEELAQRAMELLDDQIFGMDVNIEYLKFSVPADLLFNQRSVELEGQGIKYLDKLGKLFKSFDGYVTIATHMEDKQAMPNNYASPYEFSLARSVAVMNYLVGKSWMDEDRITPVGNGARGKFKTVRHPEDEAKNRRVEFVLSQTQPM